MADLRKLIASMDKLNESTAKTESKPVIAEGSMLKALNMVTKSVAPAAEMAKEFKMFKEDAKWAGHSDNVKNPNFNDELSGRRVSPPGKRLKSGKLDYNERTSQERTKALIKHQQAKGGLTGPKGPLPEGQVDEGYWDEVMAKTGKSRAERAGKPFEKNPASHDKNGVYVGDKDLAGRVAKLPKGGYSDEAHPIKDDGNEGRPDKVREAVKTVHPSHTTGHKVIKKTAQDLTNPPKAMQNRARGDQKRDAQWMGTQLAKNESVNEGAGEPDTDQILYYLTDAYRALQNHSDFYQDFSVITRIYENLRYDLKAGDYTAFQQTYEQCLSKYPDASVELFDAMFVEAGLPEEQGTIEQFLEKCSTTNEGIGDTIKRGVKGVKRGMQGWGTGNAPTPKELVKRNKEYDDSTVKMMATDTRKVTKHSPADLQKRVVDREMKKRGLANEANKHSFIGKIQRGNELKKKVDSTWVDAGAAQKKGDHPGAAKAFNKHVRYANLERPGTWRDVKESYGVFSRTDESAPIKTFALKEDAMAMAKRYNKINREEGIKYVVRNIAEAYNFKGGFPFDVDHMNGPTIRQAQSTRKKFTDEDQWLQTVNKLNAELYDDNSDYISSGNGYKVEIMGKTWAQFDGNKGMGWIETKSMNEAMPAAVSTATTKMNPNAATPAPVAATGAPSAPGAPAAPKTPGSVSQVDPAIAKAQQAAYQKNIAKLGIKGINPAQTGVAMQKQADDMQLSPTDNTNNAKIAGTLAGVLQDPAGAQQLKTLTDKFNKKPGQV